MSDVVWAESALDDIDTIIAYVAADNPVAASKIVDRIGASANQLGRMAIGRKGRIAGTYEKSVVGLPYIIAYAYHCLCAASAATRKRAHCHSPRDSQRQELAQRGMAEMRFDL